MFGVGGKTGLTSDRFPMSNDRQQFGAQSPHSHSLMCAFSHDGGLNRGIRLKGYVEDVEGSRG